MKITELETFVVGNPPPHFGGRYFIFLKLVTDDGIEGIGEVYTATFGPHIVARMIEDVCARHVIGADPFRIERLWRDVYGRGYSGRPDISLVGVLSGIEMACWDIVGKAVGSPCYELLGGQRARTPPRLHLSLPRAGRRDRRLPRPRARGRARGGVHGARLHRAEVRSGRAVHDLRSPPAGPRRPRALGALREEVREAVGDRCDLLFGTHGQFTPSGAIRLAKRLEPYDPLWFEEPTPPEMPEEMARVARATSIPIATGERLTTKYEFSRVLETGAASILQLNLGRVGGLLEAKKIAGMAEAHYAQIAPHLYCGPVVGAANIQLSACTPELPPARGDPGLGRLSRGDPEDADRVGGRLRDPVRRRRGSASSSTRTSPRGTRTRATICT